MRHDLVVVTDQLSAQPHGRDTPAAGGPQHETLVAGLTPVPGMLRRLRPDLRIGLSLPTPFPPPELFTRLPNRAELLTGLLGADVIGFQRPGAALVLSELTGAAADLPQADLVNPYDAEALRACVLAAVEAPRAAAAAGLRRMRGAVHHHTVHHWAEEFLACLDASTAPLLEASR
jgi:trehalose-6-phosphate synthase